MHVYNVVLAALHAMESKLFRHQLVLFAYYGHYFYSVIICYVNLTTDKQYLIKVVQLYIAMHSDIDCIDLYAHTHIHTHPYGCYMEVSE